MGSPGMSSPKFRVVIAGGGIAALEAALALRDLAGDRVSTTLVAPDDEFVFRSMMVGEPLGRRAVVRYSLAQIAGDIGAELHVDSVKGVDAAGCTVHTGTGAVLGYDALLLCLGARAHPPYEGAITIDDARLDDELHGLIEDVQGGYVQRLACIVPGSAGWSLPMYELALVTAKHAVDVNIELAVTIVTSEDAPLAIYGQTVSAAATGLLEQRGITIITGACCEVPDGSHVNIHPGDLSLEVDRVISLPDLHGPAVPGLPEAASGFIPVDAHCQVTGVDGVFAAGDATEFAVKHGGIATQQADAAAEAIAALAGVPIDPAPFRPVLRSVLSGGVKPLYLSAEITDGHASSSQVSYTRRGSPSDKLAAKHMASYLAEHEQPSDGDDTLVRAAQDTETGGSRQPQESGKSMVRIVLADDHAVVRRGLRLLLEIEPDFEVVAEAGDVDAARRYTHGHHPAVLVLDLNMPGGSSLTAIPEIRAQSPETQIVVLTMQDEPEYAREALAGGAIGYVLKEAADADLVEAVRLAARGEGYLTPRLGARVAAQPPGPPDDLSEREVDVLRLIALGHTNVEIGERLYISVRTVETHRANLLQKLALSSRSELVRYALDRGLVEV
jgi:DNA-binding NarL/FixJ family response regulator/NADH dehydrogenase FAD-containing subunit